MEDGIDKKRKNLAGRVNYPSECTEGRMTCEKDSKESEHTAQEIPE